MKSINKKIGLTLEEVDELRSKFGLNKLTPPPSTPWWKLFLDKFKDPIIIILCVAAAVSIAVGFVNGDLIEPVGILVAIALATGVGFWMEWDAKKKFDILNQVSDEEEVKVLREGVVSMVHKTELVPGDIVILATGDEVPADLDLFEAIDLKIDESSMTGESVPARKFQRTDEEDTYEGSGFAPWEALRGTRVMEGSGKGIVTAIGDSTEIGKTTRAAQEETDLVTPLQKQLNGLGDMINKAAFTIAAILFILLNSNHFFWTSESINTSFMGIAMFELRSLMAAVVLIVVSVPEGLPLASTLSLAFSMRTMAKENNLVKKMHASETIGSVDIILSDKTGTLTQNKMTVVSSHKLNVEQVFINASINSTADLDFKNDTVGNPTEGAILRYFNSIEDHDYRDVRNMYSSRIINVNPFNSTQKYMSVDVKDPETDEVIAYYKGAPEVIAQLMGDDSFLESTSKEQSLGRRVISFMHFSGSESVYDGSLAIEDPVRTDVPAAVEKCHKAGIDVIMMTGDNIDTATQIAKDAGFGDIWAIEAKDFDKRQIPGGINRIYPNVIARCKPSDKLHILSCIQEKGYVCAMTGDGSRINGNALYYGNIVQESL